MQTATRHLSHQYKVDRCQWLPIVLVGNCVTVRLHQGCVLSVDVVSS